MLTPRSHRIPEPLLARSHIPAPAVRACRGNQSLSAGNAEGLRRRSWSLCLWAQAELGLDSEGVSLGLNVSRPGVSCVWLQEAWSVWVFMSLGPGLAWPAGFRRIVSWSGSLGPGFTSSGWIQEVLGVLFFMTLSPCSAGSGFRRV